MGRPEVLIPIAVNKSIYLENGCKVEAVAVKKPKKIIIPSQTALHETEHAYVAEKLGTGVRLVTIVPGPGYLGLTVLEEFNEVAAVAPHVNGRGGTGQDMLNARLSGTDENVAMSVARSITDPNREEINDLAGELQEKNTMTGAELRSSINSNSKKKNLEATVFIKLPSGEERKYEGFDVEKETVLVPDEIVDISRVSLN